MEEALRGGRAERLLVADTAHGIADLLRLASDLSVPVERVPHRRLDSMTGGVVHQGAAALVSSLPRLGLEALLARLERSPQFLLLVLDGITDPQNLGAVLRSAEAAGAAGAVLPRHRSAPLTAAAVKASAGAALHLPVAEVGSAPAALQLLRRARVRCVGLAPAGDVRYDRADLGGRLALVLGSEGRGLSPGVADLCDQLLSIPMSGHVGSLNVSAAAAIVLFEAQRQRGFS